MAENEEQTEQEEQLPPGDDDLYGEDFIEEPEDGPVATGDDKKESQTPPTEAPAVPQTDPTAHGQATPDEWKTSMAAKIDVLADMILKAQQQTVQQPTPDTPQAQTKDYLETLKEGFAMTPEQANEYQALSDDLGPKIAEQQLKQWQMEHVQKALAHNQVVLMSQLMQKQQDEVQASQEVLQKEIDAIPQLAAMQNDPAQWSFANQIHNTLLQTKAYASLSVQDQMAHLNSVVTASLAPKDKPPAQVPSAPTPTEDQKKTVAAVVANLKPDVPNSMTSMGQGTPVVTEFDPTTASKAEIMAHMDMLAKKRGDELERFMAKFS